MRLCVHLCKSRKGLKRKQEEIASNLSKLGKFDAKASRKKPSYPKMSEGAYASAFETGYGKNVFDYNPPPMVGAYTDKSGVENFQSNRGSRARGSWKNSGQKNRFYDSGKFTPKGPNRGGFGRNSGNSGPRFPTPLVGEGTMDTGVYGQQQIPDPKRNVENAAASSASFGENVSAQASASADGKGSTFSYNKGVVTLKGVQHVLTHMPFENFYEPRHYQRLNLKDNKAVLDYHESERKGPKYTTMCGARRFSSLPTIKLEPEEEIFARFAINYIENREKFVDYYHYMVREVPFSTIALWKLVWFYINNQLVKKFKPGEIVFSPARLELVAEFIQRQLNLSIQTTFVRKFGKPYDVQRREALEREQKKSNSQKSNVENQ